MYVYVSGPITLGDRAINVLKAVKTAQAVLKSGHTPFLPHCLVVWEKIYPNDYETWLDYDLKWLAKCDALIRIPGESVGADIEVAWCNEHNVPTFNSVDEFRQWADNLAVTAEI